MIDTILLRKLTTEITGIDTLLVFLRDQVRPLISLEAANLAFTDEERTDAIRYYERVLKVLIRQWEAQTNKVWQS